MTVVTLFRPVGPAELALIRDSGWRRFPPRLPEQPYPVENADYARQIARDWNVASDGEGHVVRFAVEAVFIERYPVRQVGNHTHRERWIPAEDLDDLNAHIVGTIDLVESFR